MTQVQYTKHASLSCETHPEWPENANVLEKPSMVTVCNLSDETVLCLFAF